MSKRLSSQYNFAPQLKKHIGDMDVEYVFDRQSVYGKFFQFPILIMHTKIPKLTIILSLRQIF